MAFRVGGADQGIFVGAHVDGGVQLRGEVERNRIDRHHHGGGQYGSVGNRLVLHNLSDVYCCLMLSMFFYTK